MAQEFIFQLQIKGPDMSETFLIPPGLTVVGRQEGNALRINSRGVSRRHMQIESTDRACTIMDLGSANGTFVGDVRLEPNSPFTLTAGDVIKIDTFTLTYEQIPIAPSKPGPKEEPKPKASKKPAAKAEKPKAKKKPKAAPTPALPPPSFIKPPAPAPEYDKAPPGLSLTDSQYLQYLPGFFHNDFMSRFLAMFESILAPVEWNVENFDLYLSPTTAPVEFLPWLSTWFDLTLDDSWSEAQRRMVLGEAHMLFARRGTRWALSRILEIYIGQKPEIDDVSDNLDAFTFKVTLPIKEKEANRELLERLIDNNKPAHTSYVLTFA